MLRYILPVRFLLLFAAIGALAGALMMFVYGGAKLFDAALALAGAAPRRSGDVMAAVMGATDALLFGIVLVVFSCAIAFGLVFESTESRPAVAPRWMRVQSVSELKQTLIEVIIVYLVVDFATDLTLSQGAHSWDALVKPVGVILIAASLRLIGHPHKD